VDRKETRDVIIVEETDIFRKIALRLTVLLDVTIVEKKDIFPRIVERNRDPENVIIVAKKVTLEKIVHTAILKCASFVENHHIYQQIVLRNLPTFVTIVVKKDTLAKTAKDPRTLFATSVKRKVTKRWTAPHPVSPEIATATAPLAAHPVLELATEGCLPLESRTLFMMHVILTEATDQVLSHSPCPVERPPPAVLPIAMKYLFLQLRMRMPTRTPMHMALIMRGSLIIAGIIRVGEENSFNSSFRFTYK